MLVVGGGIGKASSSGQWPVVSGQPETRTVSSEPYSLFLSFLRLNTQALFLLATGHWPLTTDHWPLATDH